MLDLRQNAEARSILERDGDHLLPVYARYPVVMERGEGVYLFDSSGNRYLDLMAGLGVNALGHAHPRMEGALKLARTHARQNYRHPKHGIVALKNSYHGRTYGSLSVTGQDKYRLDF